MHNAQMSLSHMLFLSVIELTGCDVSDFFVLILTSPSAESSLRRQSGITWKLSSRSKQGPFPPIPTLDSLGDESKYLISKVQSSQKSKR